jgi:hypothetical protein
VSQARPLATRLALVALQSKLKIYFVAILENQAPDNNTCKAQSLSIYTLLTPSVDLGLQVSRDEDDPLVSLTARYVPTT